MFNILSIDVELSNVGLFKIRTFLFCMGDYLIDAIMYFKFWKPQISAHKDMKALFWHDSHIGQANGEEA
jgi:hypothetical protein